MTTAAGALAVAAIAEADVEPVVSLWQRCDLTGPRNDHVTERSASRENRDKSGLAAAQNSDVWPSSFFGFFGLGFAPLCAAARAAGLSAF